MVPQGTTSGKICFHPPCNAVMNIKNLSFHAERKIALFSTVTYYVEGKLATGHKTRVSPFFFSTESQTHLFLRFNGTVFLERSVSSV